MIPSWTNAGVLPPIRPQQPGHSPDRSPYRVPLSEVIDHFSSSPKRISILKGLLEYRAALHRLGIISGFQWLDGSFIEDVETQETRSPNDVDVVTYFSMPIGETQATLFAIAGDLFKNSYVKETYLVDAYTHVLGEPTAAHHIREISYWYSMWSHRRNGLWKGFIQVELDPQEDVEAGKILEAIQVGGVTT
jgi:hypothetical protein